jgi:5-methylcytosine-specific restriction enzyme A
LARRVKQEIGPPPPKTPAVCVLCDRPIPPQARASRHHLTPRLKGGAKLGTVLLHQICHSAVHARFCEAELARRYSTVEALKAAPELAEFLRWVQTKPADFHAPTKATRSLGAADRARRLR